MSIHYKLSKAIIAIRIAILLAVALTAGCAPQARVTEVKVTTTSTAAPTEASSTPALSGTAGPVLNQAEAETATLNSLEMLDDYPLYTMHYYGPYSQQASSTGSSENPTWACSLFAALGDADNLLYGRNFDWEYSPALLLFTDPPDGYASVSMVDIAYLVDADQVQTLTDLPLEDRRPLLDAPWWPFDGMNEHGLAVGMAAVPESEMPYDQDKEAIGSLGVIREMLDHARDADEAVAILQSYSVSWDGGPALHYLIADSSGCALLVEFYQGEMVVIPNETGYHLATNFLRASVGESAEGQCGRYDRISQQLAETGGQITTQEALDLLKQVSQEGTQWSVVYETIAGNVSVAMGREYDDAHTLHPGP